jgi:hypothetical protein
MPKLAVSLRPSNDAAVIVERKADFRRQFPRSDLVFFNSETHPLGERSLRVTPTRFSRLRRLVP